MLKIKDNVDLKELEKFGFKKHKKDNPGVLVSKWIKEECFGDDDSVNYYLDFYPIIEVIPTLNGNKCLYFHHRYDFHKHIIADILYDLIQAGLVEKV